MVSATGLGSGIDIEGLVTGLVNAERVPAEQRLLQREAKVTTLVSAFGTAKSALSDLKSSVADLKDIANYSKITAKSSASNIVDVSATSSAQAASYQVGVTNLAETQSFASTAYASTATFGTGTGITKRKGLQKSSGATRLRTTWGATGGTAGSSDGTGGRSLGCGRMTLRGIRRSA